MEDLNPFPKFDLLPRLTKAANFISRVFRNTNVPVPLYMSNHFNPEHFKTADEYQPELDFANTPHAVSEGWLPFDDCGGYIDPRDI